MKKITLAKRGDFLYITLEGSGFLRHMVRTMVGTLLEVGRGKRPAGSVKRILRGKDPGRIENISVFSFLAPLDGDIEDAELVCELAPMTVTDFREKVTTGEFFLAPKDVLELNALIRNTTNEFKLEQDRSRSLKATGAQLERHDTREVWLQWPIEFEEFNEDGSSYRVLKRVQLCGIFHMGARRFMTLYRNPYHHGRAPYVVITEDDEARRRPELSMVGRTKKQQACPLRQGPEGRPYSQQRASETRGDPASNRAYSMRR